jgi:WD40 repeat protein/DNA-binding SARP family transcriptional activator
MDTRAAEETRLDYRILGPLEVVRGDGPAIGLGGPRQRGLLALLVLRAGEVVPSERLIEDLFGEDAGEGAAGSLQTAISRLRRTLADGDSGRNGTVETRPRGYLLQAEPDDVDLFRFERLHEEGRRALAVGDARRAAEALRSALGLWRGPPLGDLAGLDGLQTEIRRLEELRLAAGMDGVDAELALGGATGLVPELEALVAAHPLQERLRGQLMLALYRSGRQADALEVFRQTRALLDDQLGLEPGKALQELERAILVHDPALDDPARPAAVGEDVVVCPFKGLASFDIGDAEFFCGRESIVAELVARVAEAPLVGVIGPSGAGKSSILRAGLLSAIASGALPGSRGWPLLVVRPGARPVAELDRACGGSLQQTVGSIPAGGRVVIAIDQLEEVFTICADEDERARFLDALVAAALDPQRRAVLAVSLRADYYGRCASYPDFAHLLARNHVLVGPMRREELERAVRVPAERAGLIVPDELAAAVVADVADEPGGLPLLSTALLELWRHRNGRTLALADYRAAGGVHGAVGRLAESAYEGLDAADRAIARSIMLRLAAGEADAAVRRRVEADEIVRGRNDVARVLAVLVDARLVTADDGAVEVAHEALLREWPRMREWLEQEAESRRLRAHVAASAREWVDGGRDPGDLYRGARLSAVLDWEAGHTGELDAVEHEFVEASRDESQRALEGERRRNRRLKGLVAGIGALLAVALAAGALAVVQQHHASHEATVALARQLGAEAVNEPRIDRAMLLAREAVNLSPSPQTEGTLLATLLRSPAAVATFSSPITSRPQSLSVSPDGRTLAASDNQGAVRFYDLVHRRLEATVRRFGFTSPVAYSPDGSLMVAPAGTIVPRMEVRNARTFAVVRELPLDRRFLANVTNVNTGPVVGRNGIVYFVYSLSAQDGSEGPAYLERWRLGTGLRITSSAPVGADGSEGIALVDGGRRLAVLGNRAVTILDATTLRRLSRYHVRLGGRYASALSPDGRTLVVGSTVGTVSFIDLATGRVTPGLGSHTEGVVAIAFSHDGKTVATTSTDGSVILWDVPTATPIERLLGHAAHVGGVTFSLDDKTLYSCSLDGAIFVWDLGTKRRFGAQFSTYATRAPLPLGGDLLDLPPPLAVSPDGTRLAVRIARSEVGIFSTGTTAKIGEFRPAVGEVASLAWSHDGLLAVTGDSGHVQLWSPGTSAGRGPHLIRQLRGMRSINGVREVVTTVAFSPDSGLVAAGDVNHTPGAIPWRYGSVAVWDAVSGKLLWLLRKKTGWVNSVAISPDGKTVAAAYETGPVVLFDARTGRPERTLRPEGAGGLSYTALAYSPDGSLVTGSWAGIVQRWNPADGAELGRPTQVATAPVSSISFSPDGSIFATAGGSDNLAKLWTTSTLQQFGASFPGMSRGTGWGNAAYTPDGKHMVVVWDDGSVQIWPTSVSAWEQHACAVAGRSFTREEWSRFVGGRPYQATCGSQVPVSGR